MIATTQLIVALSLAAGSPHTDAVRKETDKIVKETVKLYEWFHQNPELSNKEVKTAARMASELRKLGMEVQEQVGGTGLIGLMHGKKPGKGPVVLYRADMDGLPVLEETGLRYASKKKQRVMHACGHDVHMSTALGTLRVLRALESQWSGTVLFLAQPAEELGLGARQMLADSKLKKTIKKVGKPRFAVALHDAADMPAGDVSLVPGYNTANVDSVDIIVHGRGGHGSRPHQTIDPVLIAADITVTLQSIVARRIKPGERAVVTVGKIESGTKHNIISSKATLLLTVRSYGDEMRKHLLDEIRRVAINTARAHGVAKDPEVIILDEFTPSGYNDPAWTARMVEIFGDLFGRSHVTIGEPSTGGEDFGQFPRKLSIPGVMYRLGTINRARYAKVGPNRLPAIHSGQFAPDPRQALTAGITSMSLAVLEGLTGGPK